MYTFFNARPTATVAALASSRINRLGRLVLYGGLAALLPMAAIAQPKIAELDTSGLDSSGNPKSEMAACKNRSTSQARAACMTEVRNAAAAKRAGRLTIEDANYAANALKRCDVFKNSVDREACRARMGPQAHIEGSVAGGGVLREAEITVVGEAQQSTASQ